MLKIAGATVCLIFALCYSQMEVSISGNEATRFAVIEAVGEQNVFHINFTQFRSVDRIIRDGKVYSDKPLPLAWSVGILHKIIHNFTGLNFKDNYHLLIYIYNFIAGGLVNALIFIWLFDQLRRYRKGAVQEKFLIALSAVMGSWLLSYSVTVNNHTPAALAFLGWFIVLGKFSRKPALSTAVITGLAAGAVAAYDLPTGFFTGAVNVFALYFANRRCWKSALAGAAGSAAVAIFITGLNYYAYGTVMPLYIAYGGGTYTPGTGNKNHFGYAFEALLGYRGLFSYQPFLLLAVPGLWSMRKKLKTPEISALAASLLCIIFYLVMTNEYGGAAYGFRYLIPVIPVLWYFAGIWLLEQRSRFIWCIAAVMILWGVVSSLAGAYAPFCLAFEGYRSPAKHVTRTIRSSFTGNLISWSYERDPDSALTNALREFYGRELSGRYLFSSFMMQKKIEPMAKLAQEKLSAQK